MFYDVEAESANESNVVTPTGSHQAGISEDTSFIKHKDNYLVWVIAPYLETQDPNLQYYYDYTQSIAEYQKVFSEVGCEWKWVNMTFDTIEKVIGDIKNHTSSKIPIVINLCDGDESNGIPGISVIHALERHGLAYTGANEHFYQITTSKIPMKEAFDLNGVSTPRWKVVQGLPNQSNKLFDELGEVLIVKPAISAGSMGLSIRNVVSTQGELEAILQQMELGYRGWKLDTGGIFVEEFINGREFTTLVVGSSSEPASLKVYPPAERVFNGSLPDKERFLSFDRLWETYDDESPLPDKGLLYNYYEPEYELVNKLKQISIDAFRSVGGMGYGRLDIRMDAHSGQLYMLEVNAQCGLSEDENYTSIGAILRFAKKSFTYLIIEIVEDALLRYGAKHKALP
jgi:D-alanine-D-alanine ligase